MEENKKYSVEELLTKLNSAPDTTSSSDTFDILQRRAEIRRNTAQPQSRNTTANMSAQPPRPARQGAIRPNATSSQPRYVPTSAGRQRENIVPQQNVQHKNLPQRSLPQQNAADRVLGAGYNAQQRAPMPQKSSMPPVDGVPMAEEPLPISSLEDIANVQDYFNNRAIKLSHTRIRQPNIQRRMIVKSEDFTYLDEDAPRRVVEGGETIAQRSARLGDVPELLGQPQVQTEHPITEPVQEAVVETVTVKRRLWRPRKLYSSQGVKDMSADELYSDSEKLSSVSAEDTDTMLSAMCKSVKIKLLVSLVSQGVKDMSADELYSDSEKLSSVSAEDTDTMLSAMCKSVKIKLLVSLVCAVTLMYMSISQIISVPIPTFLLNRPDLMAYIMLGIFLIQAIVNSSTPTFLLNRPDLMAYIMLGIFLIQAIVNSSTIGGGFISLFTLRPDNDIYSSVAVFAATVQGAYIAFNADILLKYPGSVFMPFVSLLLLFNAVGKLSFSKRLLNTFDILVKNGKKNYIGITTDAAFTEISMERLSDDYPCIAYVKKSDGIDRFIDEGFSDSPVEHISRFFAPAVAVLSCIIALVHYMTNKDIFSTITVFAGVVSVASPLCVVIAAQLPISKLNNTLYKSGAAVSGYMSIKRLSTVNTMLLTTDQLFPSQNVALLDIKALQGVPLSRVVVDVASCLSAFNNNFTKMFRELGVNHTIKVEDAKYQDSQGYTGWIMGKRIQIGTRAFMESYNISLPHVNLERDFNNNNREVLYVANSGMVTGLIIISHTPNRLMQSALNVLCDNNFVLLVMSNDPTLTAEKIGALYKYPPELIKIVPDGAKSAFDERVLPNRIAGSTVAFENASDAVNTIFLAKDCKLFSRIAAVIVMISIVIGLTLSIAFVMLKQILSLSWITVVAYQSVWLIIVLSVIAIWRTKRN